MMVTVKIRDREQIVKITRVRCPGVGTYVKYQGRRCLVLSTEILLSGRAALEAFTVV